MKSKLTQVPNIRVNEDSGVEIEVTLKDLFQFIREYSGFCYVRTNPSKTRYVSQRLWALMGLLHLYTTSKTLKPKQLKEIEKFLRRDLKRILLLIKVR